MNKQLLVERARILYALWYGGEIDECKGCLFWADAFNAAAQEQGLDTLVQAGSAMFQFRSDDGKRDTHFSYMFEPERGLFAFRAGQLPEMHVWSWIRQTNEIVDLTTRYQAKQADEMLGYYWEPDFKLPDYLWMPVEKLPEFKGRFIYRADATATMFALTYLRDWEKRHERGGQPVAIGLRPHTPDDDRRVLWI
jgi:hypothetical protein